MDQDSSYADGKTKFHSYWAQYNQNTFLQASIAPTLMGKQNFTRTRLITSDTPLYGQ